MSKLGALILALTLIMSGAAWAGDPAGTWITENARAQVRIAPCGPAICGAIVGLKEPIDPSTGQARVDKNNTDAAKRTRPMIGVQIVAGMKPSGTDTWSGNVYNAEDGKTYSGHLTLESATRIKLEGCALGGLVCKAQYWTRAN